MSHRHRNRATPHDSNAFLLYDIDDELEGWEDDDYHLTDEVSPSAEFPSTLPEMRRHDQEPPRAADSCTFKSTINGHSEVLEDRREEASDEDDDFFINLMAPRTKDEDSDLEEDQEVETLFPGWDWGELDEFDSEDDEEVDDDPTRLTIDPAHERIALHDKSQRAAAKIIKDANWERDAGLPVLTEILVHHRCHPKTIGALRELTIEHRVGPEMLGTLHEIRSGWRSHGYNRVYSAFGACDGWPNLPWGIALHITETLGVQSESEVMEFCGVCFKDWCEVGFTEFPIFAYYLNFVVSTIDSPLADTIHAAPDTARAMLTDRGEQYDLPGNPVDQDLEYYGIT